MNNYTLHIANDSTPYPFRYLKAAIVAGMMGNVPFTVNLISPEMVVCYWQPGSEVAYNRFYEDYMADYSAKFAGGDGVMTKPLTKLQILANECVHRMKIKPDGHITARKPYWTDWAIYDAYIEGYKAQQVEIETLKGLLSRWLDTQEITMTATFYSGMKEKYESVISDTEKALK